MLRILLLEDHQDDVELIKLELNKLREKFELKSVGTKEEYRSVLESFDPQIILTDINIPGYSGVQALKDAQKRSSSGSVIVVTGTISGEEALKYVVDLGAKDYILKSNLSRLVPAVNREFEYYNMKKVRDEQDKWLEIFSQVAHQTHNGIIITDPEGNVEWVNEAYKKITGYSLEEFYKKKPGRLLRGEETNREVADFISSEINEGHPVKAELLNYSKSGEKFWTKLNISPLRNEDGEIHHFLALQEDITDEKTNFKTLEKAYERLEWAQNIGKIGDWHFNIDDSDIYWSRQMYKIYGRSPEEGPPGYEKIRSDYYGELQEMHNEAVDKAINEGIEFDITLPLKNDKGVHKYVRVIGKPSKDENGEVQSLHGVVQDVTESVEVERELKQTKRFNQLAIEGAEVGLWELDLDTHKTFFNDVYFNMLGYEREEVDFSKSFHDKVIHPEDAEEVETYMREIMAGDRKGFETTIRMKGKDGEYRHIMDRAQVVEEKPDGSPAKLAGSHIDITNMVQIELDLLRSYKEKEVLLQEIHHRVKNNLAIVSGLLWLEMDELRDTLSALPLSRSINRIQSMAKVHEMLYHSEDLSKINIKKYVEDLSHLIIGNADLPHDVLTELDIEDSNININEMIPLGLLLNELMTNSLKYAFPDEGGDIFISFRHEGDQHHVCYRDTGPGMKEELDLTDTKTLGMKIISVLLKQLDADYELDTDGQFRIDFSFQSKDRGAHSNL